MVLPILPVTILLDSGMILLDLQRAFDTTEHETFLDKMACHGFSDSTILWFKSYLQDRSFAVNTGMEYSNLGYCHVGVPQGSILGPLIHELSTVTCFGMQMIPAYSLETKILSIKRLT